MAPVCTALNLSDKAKCQEEATNINGLFCAFHARQCQNLYIGYKKRNARLETLDASIPEYLANASSTLRNESFGAVDDERTLGEIWEYLYNKHNLLERVIRARVLHHTHFYSETSDWGHQQYLGQLVSDKQVVSRALERVVRRTAEVLHKQKKWFKWVRAQQDAEDETQQKAGQKVKREAEMFKRHMKEADARLRRKKQREEEKKQEAYLDQAYEERLRQMREDKAEVVEELYDQEWDPVEDAIEGERADFIALMKRLLWLNSEETSDDASEKHNSTQAPGDETLSSNGNVDKENVAPESSSVEDGSVTSNTPLSKNAKKKARRAKAKAKAETTALAQQVQVRPADDSQTATKIEVNETREQMRERLLAEQVYNRSYRLEEIEELKATGVRPKDPQRKSVQMTEEEVERILEEVAEIKELLFCRLLLSHAAVLPAALRANSVVELFADSELSTADLRDVCLHLAKPALQEIRDACADFARGEAEESEDEEEEDQQTAHDLAMERQNANALRPTDPDQVPANWRTRHERAVDTRRKKPREIREGDATMIDFGQIDEEGRFQTKKIRVRVCGRTVWNYPSEKAMARGGWFQYSVIAKGSRFEDAVGLCRNWQEFWELSTLTMYQYFPSPEWRSWAFDRRREQQLQLGLISYLEYGIADQMTTKRRQYKNILCCCIKRNDPVSRRFVQYLSMQSGRVCILVRDAKTGRILVKPTTEHLWLVRDKVGLDQWVNTRSVGEDLFNTLEEVKASSWQFGFNEYYDVTIWDLEPGQHASLLYSLVIDTLVKAHRCCTFTDIYEPIAPIFKTLYRDKENGRVRDAKPGEQTIYDELHGEDFQFIMTDGKPGSKWSSEIPHGFFYDEVDASEDMILFPEETLGYTKTVITDLDDPITTDLEERIPSMRRFILDIPSDEDSDGYDDPMATGNIDQGPSSQRHLTQEEEDPPEDIPECPNPDDPDCNCPECAWYEDQEALIERNNPSRDRGDGYPDFDVDFSKYIEDQRVAEVVRRWADEAEIFERDPGRDFYTYVDRVKARIFKQQWHAAELDPEAKERWKELQELIEEAKNAQKDDPATQTKSWELLRWLNVHPSEHRAIWSDMQIAMAAMSFFFTSQHGEGSNIKEWLNDWLKRAATKPVLTDNESKARMEPYLRTYRSNRSLHDDFWKPAEKEADACERGQRCPPHWDVLVRPMVARLFKAGVIGLGYVPYPIGEPMVLTEPNKEPNMYIDYRGIRGQWPTSFPVRNPAKIDLLKYARTWSRQHTSAKFALFRIWTHSHFLPLMLGHNNRDWLTFCDTIGRSWQWKFVPRDFPGSEYSIHVAVENRLARFKRQFKDRVDVKRDMVLVKGENEKDLQRFATAVTFALQTNPWRMEIDLWKSFVNVDLAFLEALDDKWLE